MISTTSRSARAPTRTGSSTNPRWMSDQEFRYCSRSSGRRSRMSSSRDPALAAGQLGLGGPAVTGLRDAALVLGAVVLLQPLGAASAGQHDTRSAQRQQKHHDDDDQDDHGGVHRTHLSVRRPAPRMVGRLSPGGSRRPAITKLFRLRRFRAVTFLTAPPGRRMRCLTGAVGVCSRSSRRQCRKPV